MTIETIGVVGGGKMGSGITIAAARAGYNVILHDISEELAAGSVERIKATIDKLSSKGKMSADEAETAKGRVSSTGSYKGYDTIDFVIEVVPEKMELKCDVHEGLDKICKKEAIIVSSTSTFSITNLAAATQRPDRFAGMHFFIEPTKLVEVIRGYYTSDDTVKAVSAVAQKMGKVVVETKKDTPGFIANRVYTPLFLEAFKLYEEGVASIEEIDKAMENSYLPIGPFKLADIIGLDTLKSGLDYYMSELGQSWLAPQCLKSLIRSGRLGKKTGKGWYDYE